MRIRTRLRAWAIRLLENESLVERFLLWLVKVLQPTDADLAALVGVDPVMSIVDALDDAVVALDDAVVRVDEVVPTLELVTIVAQLRNAGPFNTDPTKSLLRFSTGSVNGSLCYTEEAGEQLPKGSDKDSFPKVPGFWLLQGVWNEEDGCTFTAHRAFPHPDSGSLTLADINDQANNPTPFYRPQLTREEFEANRRMARGF